MDVAETQSQFLCFIQFSKSSVFLIRNVLNVIYIYIQSLVATILFFLIFSVVSLRLKFPSLSNIITRRRSHDYFLHFQVVSFRRF